MIKPPEGYAFLVDVNGDPIERNPNPGEWYLSLAHLGQPRQSIDGTAGIRFILLPLEEAFNQRQ